MTAPSRCPCGSGDTYLDCCRRLHVGTAQAATARSLMQARFSAFAVGEQAYLLGSWHPSTRPCRVDLDPTISWTRLEIVECVGGGPFDVSGVVEFRAYHRTAGTRGVLHERSSFLRSDGCWSYVSGEVRPR